MVGITFEAKRLQAGDPELRQVAQGDLQFRDIEVLAPHVGVLGELVDVRADFAKRSKDPVSPSSMML